jgi:hypothetical protein
MERDHAEGVPHSKDRDNAAPLTDMACCSARVMRRRAASIVARLEREIPERAIDNERHLCHIVKALIVRLGNEPPADPSSFTGEET